MTQTNATLVDMQVAGCKQSSSFSSTDKRLGDKQSSMYGNTGAARRRLCFLLILSCHWCNQRAIGYVAMQWMSMSTWKGCDKSVQLWHFTQTVPPKSIKMKWYKFTIAESGGRWQHVNHLLYTKTTNHRRISKPLQMNMIINYLHETTPWALIYNDCAVNVQHICRSIPAGNRKWPLCHSPLQGRLIRGTDSVAFRCKTHWASRGPQLMFSLQVVLTALCWKKKNNIIGQ